MKVVFITFGDARDIKNWSGAVYAMLTNLESLYPEVIVIDRIEKTLNPLILLFRIIEKIFKKSIQYRRLPLFLKPMARRIKKRIGKLQPDLLFSPSSLPFAYLDLDCPKAFWADATFKIMVEYYPEFQNLPKKTLQSGELSEKRAIENVDLAIYASEWAAESAIRDYHAEPEKVIAVPMGANLENLISDLTASELIEERISKDTIQLLTVGADWIRKGFNLTIDIANEIYKLGYKVELHLVGASPDYLIQTVFPYVHHGKLYKNILEQNKTLNYLYQHSHFFILPSVAECAGIVFAEASAYALPSITRNTGGIPTMVESGVNGFVLDYHAKPAEYAKKIVEVYADKQAYRDLCHHALQKFNNELNWNSSFQLLDKAFRKMTRDNSSVSQLKNIKK
jgi:glycosyltransferase involved in cell wall biosynthesis